MNYKDNNIQGSAMEETVTVNYALIDALITNHIIANLLGRFL